MKNKRKQMLLSSAIMLIVAVLALTSTTFAWFTTTNTANVQEIKFKASTAGGIDMSFTAANDSWRSTVTASDFVAANNGILYTGSTDTPAISGATSMTPVSAANAYTTGGKLPIFAGTVENGVVTASAAAVGSGYYAFNLYFRNTGAEAISLKLDTTSAAKSGVAGDASNGGVVTGIEDAVRVAFIYQGATASDVADPSAAARALAATAAGNATIWMPNYKTHTTFATSTSRVTAGDAEPAYQGITEAGTFSYTGGRAVAGGQGMTGSTAAVTTESGDGADITIATIGSNKIIKVTVYVWIEGQDVDCNNAEAAGNVVANLAFVGV